MKMTSAVKWVAYLVVSIAFLAGQNASAEFLCNSEVTGTIESVNLDASTIVVVDVLGVAYEFIGVPVSYLVKVAEPDFFVDAEVTVYYHQCPSADSLLKACSITIEDTEFVFNVHPGQSHHIPPAPQSSNGFGIGKGKGPRK
jgi:hypothetical protein